jgi:hypothetical protein
MEALAVFHVLTIRRKLEDADDSDLTVKVGNVKYKVYKLVFCTLSRFFEKAAGSAGRLVKTGEGCNGELCRSAKESHNDEEADANINSLVANGEEEVVADIDDETEVWTGDQKCRHRLTFHVNMFALAGNFFCSRSSGGGCRLQ